MITYNAIRCNNCNTVIESKHRHDFRTCPCGRVFVDGGRDYQRIGWTGDGGPGYTVLEGPGEDHV